MRSLSSQKVRLPEKAEPCPVLHSSTGPGTQGKAQSPGLGEPGRQRMHLQLS